MVDRYLGIGRTVDARQKRQLFSNKTLHPNRQPIHTGSAISLETCLRDRAGIALHRDLASGIQLILLMNTIQNLANLLGLQQGRRSATKKDTGEWPLVIGQKGDLREERVHKAIDQSRGFNRVEVAVGALLVAEGNVEIEAEHRCSPVEISRSGEAAGPSEVWCRWYSRQSPQPVLQHGPVEESPSSANPRSCCDCRQERRGSLEVR